MTLMRRYDSAPCADKGQNVVAVDFYNQTIDPDTSMTIAAAAATDKNHIGGVAVGINGDAAGALDANYYKGCGERQGVEREVVAIGIGRDAFNSGENAQMAQSISDEVQPPMTAKGPGGVCTNGEPRRERM